MPPKPPPKHPEHKHIPPHELKRYFWGRRLFSSIAVGCIVTAILGITLWLLAVPITTILPVAAPIWVGVTTLTYQAIGDRLG